MSRPHEIAERFLAELDKHIDDIASGRKDEFYDIKDFAAILCIHPTHLSATIKETTGKAPCEHCEGRLAVVAKRMLTSTDWPVSKVAAQLTYDPPTFSRFFKKFVGVTPSVFRQQVAKNANA